MTITTITDSSGNQHDAYNSNSELENFIRFYQANILDLLPSSTPERMDVLTHANWGSAIVIDLYDFSGTVSDPNKQLAFGRDNLEKNGSAVAQDTNYTPPEIFKAALLIGAQKIVDPAFGSIDIHTATPGNIKKIESEGNIEYFPSGTASQTATTGQSNHPIQNVIINDLILPFTNQTSRATPGGATLGRSESYGTDTRSYFANRYNKPGGYRYKDQNY